MFFNADKRCASWGCRRPPSRRWDAVEWFLANGFATPKGRRAA
jgi:hypothetical protein